MSFSSQWDQIYKGSGHLSIWPWSDVVSYVHRYAKPSAGYTRVLELGCGPGANIPLFLNLGAEYFSIEGSQTIVEQVIKRYPQLTGRIAAGDFTRAIPFEGSFDLLLDRASLIHNATADMQRGLELASDKLRVGGKFIGVDWFSDQHSGSLQGEPVDSHTRRNLPSTSSLSGTGNVHFCDEAHLVALLENAGLVIDRLEHKRIDPSIPSGHETVAVWNFVATKDRK